MLYKLFLFITFLTIGWGGSVYAAGAVRIPEWLIHSSTADVNCRSLLTKLATAQDRRLDHQQSDPSAFQRFRRMVPQLKASDLGFLEQLRWKSALGQNGIDFVIGQTEIHSGFLSEVQYYSRAHLSMALADPNGRNFIPHPTFKLSFRRPNSLLGKSYENEFSGFCEKISTTIYPVRCAERAIGTDRVFVMEMSIERLRSQTLLQLKILLQGLGMTAEQPIIYAR